MTRRLTLLVMALLLLGMPSLHAATINDDVRVQLWHAYQPPTVIHVHAPGLIHADQRWRPLPKAGLWLVIHDKVPRVCLDSACHQTYPVEGASLMLKATVQQPLHLSAQVRSRWGTQEPMSLTRFYNGLVTAKAGVQGWVLVNRVPAQDYVTSVVASETLGGWPLEALKVHSVLIQTRLRKHMGVHVDSTEDQRYTGVMMDAQPVQVRLAVLATWGEWLSLKETNSPADVFFHSACAGRTSEPSSMSLKPPVIKRQVQGGVVCRDCQHSPFWRSHGVVIPWERWAPVFGRGLPKITQQDAAGRPLWVTLPTGKAMSGYDLWLKMGQRFGWDKCPGRRYGFTSTQSGMVVTSTGAGHGVGVCQWGAAQKARGGVGYREILKAYYPRLALHSPHK